MRILITISFILALIIKLSAQCTVGDVLNPIIVDTVSVSNNGDVTICWQPSTDPDIDKYYIFYVNPLTGANDIVDSINAPASCFTILAANNNASNESEQYAIGVKDLCDNEMLTILDYHNTLFLQNTIDVCSATISLNWNSYDDFNSGLNVSYNIYVSENAGPYTVVGTTSNITNFDYNGVNQGSIYNFYVTAVENGGVGPYTASSNTLNINTNFFLKEPNFLYLYTATVVDSQQINVQFYVDTTADIKRYELQRSLNSSGPFTTIISFNDMPGMNPLINHRDYNVDANYESYHYRVIAIDLCDATILTSNLGSTMLLEVTSNSVSAINTITLSPYNQWQGEVDNYQLFRAVNGIWESAPIAVLNPFGGTRTFIDNVAGILEGNGEFCYKAIAYEKPITHVGNLPETSSNSNEACAIHSPIFYIPNAFIPNGDFNPIFKPILNYIEPETYLFTIYDRWGKRVFETIDITEGWDGKSFDKSNESPSGIYIYSIKYESAAQEEFQKRGKITLIR